jgi:hypothetical protein
MESDMRYRKKPVVIEAIKWDGFLPKKDVHPVWFYDAFDFGVIYLNRDGSVHIKTLEGIMTASIGDWIIRGVKNEIYSCKHDIFLETYEDDSEYPPPPPQPVSRIIKEGVEVVKQKIHKNCNDSCVENPCDCPYYEQAKFEKWAVANKLEIGSITGKGYTSLRTRWCWYAWQGKRSCKPR